MLYSAVRFVFRWAVPQAVKTLLFDGRFPALNRLRAGMESRAGHDAIYDRVYYAEIDQYMLHAASVISGSILSRWPDVRSVLDVGCGTGALLAELSRRGVSGIGLEKSAEAIRVCKERGVDVRTHDLEAGGPSPYRVDLVISTEVAEHLPESLADTFIDFLTASGPRVVMTAATPGQGGTDHVNEQPHEYWIAKMSDRGFTFDATTTTAWRETWRRAEIDQSYVRNVMVFESSRGRA